MLNVLICSRISPAEWYEELRIWLKNKLLAEHSCLSAEADFHVEWRPSRMKFCMREIAEYDLEIWEREIL